MTYKPKNILFGILWVIIFSVFAYYIYSGKLFEPDANGKINVVAILIAWVAEYISKLGTALLVLAIGLAIGAKVALSKK
jgi:hypothetical protein